jgi:phenylacetaldehyde dehydrogenase
MTDLLPITLPTDGLAGCFIDGAWHTPDSTLEVENPSRREVIAEVGRGGAAEIDLAVTAARRALPAWRSLPASQRGALLSELGRRLTEHHEEVARLLAAETGNTIRTQSRGETSGAASVLTYFGGVAVEQKGEVLPFGSDLFSYSTREPIGVVGSIIPWNSPLQLGCGKIAMALATGNTLVLKPAEDAPLAVLRLTELAADVFPPGVFNVVTGVGADAGAALAAHPDVDKLSFTGSSEVGFGIARNAADRMAHATLELGGKSPCIVFPDAATEDRLATTAQRIINAMRFARQGQSCTAGSRLFVHEDVWEPVMAKVVEIAESMVIGDALDERTDIGAIINAKRYDAVRTYIGEAEAAGAEFLTGATPLPVDDAPSFQPVPTILAGVDNDWRINREEVFGPVMVAIPWTNEAEVIAMANDTHYGLAAYIFSHDVDTVMRVSRALEAGWIWINEGGGQIPGMSYGGIKQSGMGREYSIEGALEAYTTRKSVTMRLGT